MLDVCVCVDIETSLVAFPLWGPKMLWLQIRTTIHNKHLYLCVAVCVPRRLRPRQGLSVLAVTGHSATPRTNRYEHTRANTRLIVCSGHIIVFMCLLVDNNARARARWLRIARSLLAKRKHIHIIIKTKHTKKKCDSNESENKENKEIGEQRSNGCCCCCAQEDPQKDPLRIGNQKSEESIPLVRCFVCPFAHTKTAFFIILLFFVFFFSVVIRLVDFLFFFHMNFLVLFLNVKPFLMNIFLVIQCIFLLFVKRKDLLYTLLCCCCCRCCCHFNGLGPNERE